ncbi:MAG: hypothetical protein D3909_14970, partial [Candidatus Electrothrix sp. ATG1]|nr:hypothetical protein [Candidatus Electrothrix sp. ATG1]
LEVTACRIESTKMIRPKNLLVLANNALAESYQNATALDICHNFSLECGMTWAGGLALGGGEALVSGHSLTGIRGFRGFKRPPLYYVKRALNMTAAALAEGHSVPEKAVRLLSKKPLPFVSFNIWCRIYTKAAGRIWEQEAAKNGLKLNALFEKPYTK